MSTRNKADVQESENGDPGQAPLLMRCGRLGLVLRQGRGVCHG